MDPLSLSASPEGFIGRLLSTQEGLAQLRRALAARPLHELARVISPMLDVSHSDASPSAVQSCPLMGQQEMAAILLANILVSGGRVSILRANAQSNRWAIPRSVRVRRCKPLKFQVRSGLEGSHGR